MKASSRRGVMGAAAALLPTMPAVAVPAVLPTVQPDAELTAACALFCAFGREWREADLAADRMPHDDPERDRMEAEADRLQDEQHPRVAAILALPCTTLAGARALAAALAECDQDLFSPRHVCTDDLLTAQLVRAVLAMNGGGPA